MLDLKKEFATAAFKKIPLLTVSAKNSFTQRGHSLTKHLDKM